MCQIFIKHILYGQKAFSDSSFLTAPLIRPPLTRNSSVCRSRRSLMSQPSSLSADPDLLSMASVPLAYRPEGDDEHIFFTVERKGCDIYSFFAYIFILIMEYFLVNISIKLSYIIV